MSTFDDSLTDQWEWFRAEYWYQHRLIHGVRWEYIVAGVGEQALLLLPGAPGRGETSFQYVLQFAPHYRVIAPSYPAEVGGVDALVDGLVALLRGEGIGRAHVVGGSYSGLIAQCLLRRYPAVVDRLVLSDTGVPDARRARHGRWLMRCLAVLPFGVVRGLLKAATYAFVYPMGAERVFWRRYFHALLDKLSRDDLLSRLAVVWDIDAHCCWTPWTTAQGAILILAADDDGVFGATATADLQAMYPCATTQIISVRGHAGSLAAAPAYIAAIGAFLDGKADCA